MAVLQYKPLLYLIVGISIVGYFSIYFMTQNAAYNQGFPRPSWEWEAFIDDDLANETEVRTEAPITEAPTDPLTPVGPQARSACSWKDEAQGTCKLDLKDDLRVGIITYYGAHDTKIKKLKESWLKDYLIDKSVFIISDKESKEDHIVDSQCAPGVSGLCCKTIFLYKYLYSRSPQAKWFFRVMDDTYVHLPNLLEYLSHFNESEPLLMGMRQVISSVNDWQRFEETQNVPNELLYPQGGAGWVMSRAYLEKLLDPTNLSHLSAYFAERQMIDDLGFGQFTYQYLNIPITHNKGFAHIAWHLHTCKEGIRCPDGPRATFNTTFFSFHSRVMWEEMTELHNIFVDGSYYAEYIPSPVHNDRAVWQICKCKENT